jgi:hypothetical protein
LDAPELGGANIEESFKLASKAYLNCMKNLVAETVLKIIPFVS